MTDNIVWDGPIVQGYVLSMTPITLPDTPAGLALSTQKSMLLLH